ncbi:MAG: magnesium transporter CorA family protein [Bacteroidetes bacterium]|nr:magnesium transporter CorA family protein [Bacteroidota bacterium]
MIETINFGKLTWSHIVLPTANDLANLKSKYNFHDLVLEDCLTEVNMRPKIDIYDNYYFIILHFPTFDEDRRFVEVREIKFFLGSDYLISIGRTHWLVYEMFRKEKNKKTDRLQVESSDVLLYQILDHVMLDVRKLVDLVDQDVDQCGKALFGKNSEPTIEKISVTRKNIILLNTMFKPQMDLFNKLQNGTIRGFDGNMQDYWSNIMDYFQKLWDVVEDDGELIRGYSMTFDSLQVNRTNEVIKILTLISSILLPLTFIASLYGMNIKLPMQDHPFSFAFVAGAMVSIAVLMFVYFKIKKWM